MKKNKVTFKEKMTTKVNEGLKKAFKPLLNECLETSYNILLQIETSKGFEELTSYEEFLKMYNQTLKERSNNVC
jgi:hypothetical protein